MTKGERLIRFFETLDALPAARSFDEAWAQIESTLNAIEDRFSGVSFDPEAWMTDGRMYPPQMDRERMTDKPGARRFRTVAHNVYVGLDGSIEMREVRTGRTIYSKRGADR